ncbi:MAG: hypothetical protein V1875_09430 [Candidatus Altiarchaeota archaeon]
MLEWLAEALTVIGLLASLALIILILKALIEKGGKSTHGDVLAVSQVNDTDSNPPEAEEFDREEAPARQESESQRLARTEKELAERDAKVKAERVRELQERERLIKRRETDDAAVAAPAASEPDGQKEELSKERQRILELIKKTEERYANGEMQESSFKSILSDYQRQIIDIDIKLRKKKGR